MSRKQISLKKIKGIISLYALNDTNFQIAKTFRISRTTVNKYIGYYKDSNLVYNDIASLSDKAFINSILEKNKITSNPTKHYSLRNQLQIFHKKLETENTSLKLLWKEYKQNNPSGFEYSQFVFLYHQWCKENGLKKACYNKWKMQSIPKEDMKILKKWRLSTNRRKWERSVALLELYKGCSITKISKKIERSWGTIKKWHIVYINKGIEHLDLKRTKRVNKQTIDNIKLRNQLQTFHKRLETENINLKLLWKEYRQNNPSGYEYSQFVFLYHQWCKENGLKKACYNKWKMQSIPKEDMKILKKLRLSTDRRKWERSVALLELYKGCNITKISKKIERSCRTIKKWHIVYINKGIEHLDLKRTKRVDKQTIDNLKLKKERLIKIIHELPSLHDINRTSWSLEALAQAYEKLYGETISKSTISEYVRSEGFTFKKAKEVLTSPDPEYRIKLKKITNILSNLGPREKFFSIDEFGPFAIKIRGGRAFVPKDQIRTIPQWQKSKGSLICTAALELSTNQITHFYSSKKDTDEMIKLLEILLNKYATEERIFFSWDAASWHASKKLYEKVEEVNDPEYRAKHKNPIVELAPLPISAQFLNVIESVFSGMAKAIIHNSDYQSVEECKLAIDRYFSERNQAFIKNPKRAGKKIWGKEIVKPVFRECNNCKDPNCR